ncbi:hypothetical protein [Pedobacter sp. KLB.chiD]|jgi:undecaprenyl-diphosphatase|uniref:hypothetical protein n=1 Tax=Pedobacter sp. KLB.chiD TaxID=3387402 RepID=UPI00399BD7BD
MRDKIPFPVLITTLVFLGLMGRFMVAESHISSYFERADKSLLLFANQNHSGFWDAVMKESASFWFWIPFYCFLLLRLVTYDPVRFSRMAIFIIVYLMVSLGGLLSFNAFFGHLRPLYDHEFRSSLRIGVGGAGAVYGCLPVCSAAAGLAFLLALFFGRRYVSLNVLTGLWALLYIYSRAYNSWNYPREILIGTGLSLTLGYLSFRAYRFYLRKNYAG